MERNTDSTQTGKKPRNSIPVAPAVAGYVVFVGLFYLLYRYAGYSMTTDDGAIMLSPSHAALPIGLALLLGALVILVLKVVAPLWSQDDTKKASGWSVGLVFAGGICFGGGCLPLATMGALGAVLLLLPFNLGTLLAGFFLKRNLE